MSKIYLYRKLQKFITVKTTINKGIYLSEDFSISTKTHNSEENLIPSITLGELHKETKIKDFKG